jgi:hypothetical protein
MEKVVINWPQKIIQLFSFEFLFSSVCFNSVFILLLVTVFLLLPPHMKLNTPPSLSSRSRNIKYII